MKTQLRFSLTRLGGLPALGALLFWGCAGGGDPPPTHRGASYHYALVACSDFAGQNTLALLQLKPVAEPRLKIDPLLDLGTDRFLDPVVRTNDLTGNPGAYVIQREYFSGSGLGTVAVLDPATRFQVATRYPANDGVHPSNPYDLLVLSTEEAYITRWDRAYNDILIVNPQTGEVSGTINFTGKGTNVNRLPRLDKMLFLHDRVWVLLQNINASFTEYGPGLIGMINPETHNLEALIPLEIKNPADLTYDDETNRIYVAGTGDWFDPATAGLEAVDPDQQTSDGIRIRGNELGGFITHMVMKDASHAYLVVTKSDWSGDLVVEVNPFEETVGQTVYEYPGLYVSDLAIDDAQNLLIADNTGSKVLLIDLNTGRLADTLETLVPPVSLAVWQGEEEL